VQPCCSDLLCLNWDKNLEWLVSQSILAYSVIWGVSLTYVCSAWACFLRKRKHSILTFWGTGGGRYMQSNAFNQLMGDKCSLSLLSNICISVFDYARLAAFLLLKSVNASGAMINQTSWRCRSNTQLLCFCGLNRKRRKTDTTILVRQQASSSHICKLFVSKARGIHVYVNVMYVPGHHVPPTLLLMCGPLFLQALVGCATKAWLTVWVILARMYLLKRSDA